MMKRRIVFRSASIVALVLAASALAADKTKSEEAFDRLALLQGEWQGIPHGVNTTLIYTLTANGSTLMEQCRPEKGHEMITMFTVDGDHLITTHYCSARNQPQMATAAISDAQTPPASSVVRCSCLKSP